MTCGATLLACLAGCTPKPPMQTAPPAPGAAAHVLTWDSYYGLGDKEKAEYYLDGAYLGQGNSGLRTLRLAISKMPRGSSVMAYPLMEEPKGGSAPPQMPFDVIEMSQYSITYGIFLAISAGE